MSDRGVALCRKSACGRGETGGVVVYAGFCAFWQKEPRMSRYFWFVLLLVSAMSEAGEVNKCRKADGSLAFTDQPCPPGTTKESLSPGATISVIPAPDIPVSVPGDGMEAPVPAVSTEGKAPKSAVRQCADDDERCVDDWPGPNDVPTDYTYEGGTDDGRVIDDDRSRPPVRPRPKVGR